LIFHDDVDALDGVISVFPGSTAVLLGDLTVQPQATLLAELAGTDDDNGFGTAEVVGEAMLMGTVSVSLAGGYEPQAGDSFQLLSAGGGISGALSLGDVPALAGGLGWGLDVGANHVVLNVLAPVLDGDYNRNGIVDAADYTVYRDLLGQMGEGLAADGTGPGGVPDGIVNQLDYQLWVDNFGNTLAGGAGSTDFTPADSPGANYAVPEPGAWVLALIGLAAVGGAGYRRRLLHWNDAPAVGGENR